MLTDPEQGEFRVVYRQGDQSPALRVQTTARIQPEWDWVKNEIERMINESA